MIGYVALGSNLGDREEYLRAGLRGLAEAGLAPVGLSSVWETEPVGPAGPTWFLNLVARIDTELPPLDVLRRLLEIERRAGRVRTTAQAQRVLDLDLLLLGDQSWADAELELPHPRMWQRRFVLEPLAELDPGLVDPRTGRTARATCAALGAVPAVRRRGALAPPKRLPV